MFAISNTEEYQEWLDTQPARVQLQIEKRFSKYRNLWSILVITKILNVEFGN